MRASGPPSGSGVTGRRVPPEEVRRIAGLARLRLREAEVERLAGEMGRVLAHFEELEEAGPGADEAGAIQERALVSRTRPDAAGADPLLLAPGDLAPDWREEFFVVPRLPGMEDGRGSAPDPGKEG